MPEMTARTSLLDETESSCGETVDHVERMVYEDAEVEQWQCTRCGAEWLHDKDPA